jgi:hypothetical protein
MSEFAQYDHRRDNGAGIVYLSCVTWQPIRACATHGGLHHDGYKGHGIEIRCGNPDQKAASTSLARYRDRRSLSQVCNEAISEIGAELYSSEDANYSKR